MPDQRTTDGRKKWPNICVGDTERQGPMLNVWWSKTRQTARDGGANNVQALDPCATPEQAAALYPNFPVGKAYRLEAKAKLRAGLVGPVCGE